MPIGEDAIGGAFFQVEVEGVPIAQFKEVSGLSIEISTIEHRENKPGAIPIIKKLPGATKHSDVTLKRGKTQDQGFWQWIKEVQDGQIDKARRNASVVLYDYARGEQVRYNLANCWPSKIACNQLDAAANGVVVEEMTMVHEGLTIG